MGSGLFSRLRKRRERRALKQARGLCLSCGNKAVNKNHCEKHRNKLNLRLRNKRLKENAR